MHYLVIDIECSPAVGCTGISFDGFDVSGPAGQAPRFICQNVEGLSGLSGKTYHTLPTHSI